MLHRNNKSDNRLEIADESCEINIHFAIPILFVNECDDVYSIPP